MTDGYQLNVSDQEAAALALTDLLINVPKEPDAQLADSLREHFEDAEIAELMLGVGLFLGMSKVLITLGVEPEDMPTTVIPTPGSR